MMNEKNYQQLWSGKETLGFFSKKKKSGENYRMFYGARTSATPPLPFLFHTLSCSLIILRLFCRSRILSYYKRYSSRLFCIFCILDDYCLRVFMIFIFVFVSFFYNSVHPILFLFGFFFLLLLSSWY